MEKIAIVTRGRTGSSAIIDELRVKKYLSAQELFSSDKSPNLSYYKNYFPYEKSLEKYFLEKNKGAEKSCLTYIINLEFFATFIRKKVLVFKVLSSHFSERPYLLKILTQRGYRIIYLRRNPSMQVISGLIAKKRRLYNTKKNYIDSSTYEIAVDDFKWHAKFEYETAEADISLLKSKMELLEVWYEDYLSDRNSFFEKVYKFIGITSSMPNPSNFNIMIRDPKTTIKNYEEINNASIEIGFPIE